MTWLLREHFSKGSQQVLNHLEILVRITIVHNATFFLYTHGSGQAKVKCSDMFHNIARCRRTEPTSWPLAPVWVNPSVGAFVGFAIVIVPECFAASLEGAGYAVLRAAVAISDMILHLRPSVAHKLALHSFTCELTLQVLAMHVFAQSQVIGGLVFFAQVAFPLSRWMIVSNVVRKLVTWKNV